MVCGAFTELRVPLTFCPKCLHSPEADKIRKEFHEWCNKKPLTEKQSLHAQER
jgi:hypothetical protein